MYGYVRRHNVIAQGRLRAMRISRWALCAAPFGANLNFPAAGTGREASQVRRRHLEKEF